MYNDVFHNIRKTSGRVLRETLKNPKTDGGKNKINERVNNTSNKKIPRAGGKELLLFYFRLYTQHIDFPIIGNYRLRCDAMPTNTDDAISGFFAAAATSRWDGERWLGFFFGCCCCCGDDYLKKNKKKCSRWLGHVRRRPPVLQMNPNASIHRHFYRAWIFKNK